MSRARTRISRGLIVVLAVTVVLGVVVTVRKLSRAKADAPQPVALAAPAPIAAVDPNPSPVEAPAKAPEAASTLRPLSVTITPAPGQPAAAPAVTARGVEAVAKSVATAKPAEVAKPAEAAPSTRPAVVLAAGTEAGSSHPLEQGRERMKAGDLLGARKILNNALTAGTLNPQEVAAAKSLMSEINQTVVFSAKRFADDEYGGTYNVQSGDRLVKIATSHDVTWELLARLNGITPQRLRAGQTIKVIQGPFHAVVRKRAFVIDIYLGKPGGAGSMYVTTFPVGLGKDDSTPNGVWQVATQNKLKNPKFWGAADLPAREADDPQNPLGEYWIGLSGLDGHAVGKFGYGIHGTIEPDSIGKQESHGCIRLREPDIQWVYELLVEAKSTVVVEE